MSFMKRLQQRDWTRVVASVLILFLSCWAVQARADRDDDDNDRHKRGRTPPNILFFIMDDVGIDQMKAFGYGGLTPPSTPNIDAIANAGVRFRNTWAMPECSPSRAMFFEGRYPFRTNIGSAILAQDLANSQVSPYETTTPKILRNKGYQSALFGKFHLTGSDVNPATNPLGNQAPFALGWDYFAGSQDGAPHPIDTTAGGVRPTGTYQCGFVPNRTEDPTNGFDTGACYLPNSTCTPMTASAATPTPGRSCMERGGIFDPGAVCQPQRPANLNFNQQNAYYAGQFAINRPDGSVEVIQPADTRARGYRTTIETNFAVDWIKQRSRHEPWMATVSYSSAHAPYQQPPVALLPAKSVPTGGFDCTQLVPQRVLSNQMIESMDAEIGRVLVETGIATRRRDGTIKYDPDESNTMIVLLGDNGTYYPGVKAPFNIERAKGTVYQTGVWVPLIVAGPLVEKPDRDVEHMVNVADLFELFGEISGQDVHKLVPKVRPIDSAPMLPYLVNPRQDSLRKTNFTQIFDNIKETGTVISPCVIQQLNVCTQIFPQQQLCAAENGTWYGPNGVAGPQGLTSCCAVNKFLLQNNQPIAKILSTSQLAIRNDSYKLVMTQTPEYNQQTDQCDVAMATEFYRINEAAPLPRLDNANLNLLAPGRPPLTPRERAVFANLSLELKRLLSTHAPCPGDGNLDGVVNEKDRVEWARWVAATQSQSSWYDFNFDGLTNGLDLQTINDNFGQKCPGGR